MDSKKMNNKTVRKDLGQITLGHFVYLTDPGYTPEQWCCGKTKVHPGTYNCSVWTAGLKDWGKRTVSIKIVHTDFSEEEIDKFHASKRRKFVENVYVDSGQAGFFDKDYFEANQNKPGVEDDKTNVNWYNRICEITLNRDNPHGTIDGLGVVTDSGLGDGAYPCFAWKNKWGDTVALEIVFLTTEDIKEINSEA